ncbi:aminoglycoside phosphotransferase family protein [Jiangella aurantiaca]|uniref:aminoglycoside phosphotransferase family protein n=1 Tax=Jiangella aurantiaca TaxID=2530373 RepID=UPI00193D8364|nr:aminoglycoside phosphotransferase family protein [Jiangella aurantiaca]
MTQAEPGWPGCPGCSARRSSSGDCVRTVRPATGWRRWSSRSPRADGTPAVLRLQPVGEETTVAVLGLRTWDGDGVVRLLDHDTGTGAMLLERLDAARPLTSVADDDTVMTVPGELLVRLVAVPAPDAADVALATVLLRHRA